MPGTLSFDDLKSKVASGEVDTVIVCIIDMQGRLMGKRLHARYFVDSGARETHCCNYLMATDLEMATPGGYASTSWQAGYGDYTMRPDLTTLRPVAWHEGTVLVFCDLLDHHTNSEVPFSPRAMLKAQIARCQSLGFDPVTAAELEFFLFQGTHDEIAARGFRDLRPISSYNEDYNIFQTGKEEFVMRPVRNGLVAMGIPIEGSKGEAETGQGELNIRYAGAMDTADYYILAKHALKEIAHQNGLAATFMPKWHHDKVGSAAHIHQSLWQGGKNAFHDEGREIGKSELMDHYLAGLMAYAADYTFFMAPYVNSYKRFAKASFAPTQIVWSVDNRTAAFRICGEGTSAVRIECRTPGADMNPYLAQAAMLAAGLKGIEEKLPLAAPYRGDAYSDDEKNHIPRTLRDAREALVASDMLREAFGDAVVDHYARAAEWELEEFDRVVTDWEIARGFERA